MTLPGGTFDVTGRHVVLVFAGSHYQLSEAELLQREIAAMRAAWGEFAEILIKLISDHVDDFENGFITESVDKIEDIYHYYAAFYGLNPFPYKRCNAPWVSTVVEADGSVRPCFFHDGCSANTKARAIPYQ